MKKRLFDNKVILITGGTGSFGHAFVKAVLKNFKPKKLIVFSRDELKQYEMQKEFNADCMRYFIGDVRDKNRLYRALNGVDYVVHAAALKQVPAAEYNPSEAIETNVMGAENLIFAAIENKVKKVVALSSDKAVNPINLYGATKLCADKLFVAANSYVGADRATRFSIVRYGNVVGSRGSVTPLFKEMKKTGILTITDLEMTRFWITLKQGVDLVMECFKEMFGGEIFVPRIPSMKIVDMAKTIASDCKIKIIGIRPGEKLHEVLISEDDARYTREYKDCYVTYPAFHLWEGKIPVRKGGKSVPERFRYSSDCNKQWLTIKELRRMIDEK